MRRGEPPRVENVWKEKGNGDEMGDEEEEEEEDSQIE